MATVGTYRGGNYYGAAYYAGRYYRPFPAEEEAQGGGGRGPKRRRRQTLPADDAIADIDDHLVVMLLEGMP